VFGNGGGLYPPLKTNVFSLKNCPTSIGIILFANGVGYHYEKKGCFATCFAIQFLS
jgi:hypothetical protein